jgi:glycosyltransferase involved in cell wall biosynthesis
VTALRISIITPSYNHAQFIGRTIDSVLSQQGEFELDYKVIDGASSDGTQDILRRYDDPRMSWVSEPDKGQVDAINKGLRGVTGDIVGWVNSDDVLLPGALARVARAFREHPEVGWLHGRCEIIDADDRPVRRWVSWYKHQRAKRHSFDNLLTENYVSQMTAFWRRALHYEVGYLNPALELAFDYDLWLRFARRGPPLYLDDRIACFRWYPTSKSGAQFDAQFREDAEVAAQYADGRFWPLLRKRSKNAAIVSTYRALAFGRSLTSKT